MKDRFCRICDEPLRGRSDQKFCNDSCRTTYHNNQFTKSKNYIIKINRKLRRNRKILKDVYTENKKAKVLKEVLINKGFDFDCFSSIQATGSGIIYHFCYDFGYSHIENNKYIMLRKKKV